MSKQYFSLLTNYGTQAFAKAVGNKIPVPITHMAVGDGNGQNVTPTATQTALVKEVYRAAISSMSVDPRNNKQIIFELIIPENIGGFYVREMGIYDNANKLVAVANCPESFKPTLESGSGKVQVMRMILKVSSADAVTITMNNAIYATQVQLNPKTIGTNSINRVDDTGHSHEIDDATTEQAGIVQLTSDLTLDNERLALTAKAGKALKALIDAVVKNLANYIPNSKKSNAVDSTSSDTVATSLAAKTAYDKAVSAEIIASSKYTAQNATTTQRGLTQHYSGYDSDREDLSASAKVIKILKGFIDSNTRRFDNYILNSKKSSAVDSNSADTVATSAAVKATYDLAAAKQSPQTTLRGYGITDAVQIGGGADQTRNKIFMGWSTALRLKVQVDSTDLGNVVFDNHLWSALGTRVKKDGDEIKSLTIKNGEGSLDIHSTTSSSAAVHMRSKNGKHPQTSILSVVTGNNATELRVFNTTPGSNFETNRRAHVATVNHKGEIWTLAYGLLHDYFLRRTEFESWKNKFQLAVYSGSNSVSRLYRVPLTDNTGFKIYTSLITIGANQSGHRFRLAEEMNGLRVGLAVGSSVGLETYNVAFESDTSVLIYCPVKQNIQIVNLFLIAEYQY